jgi:hypothetical protein
MIAVCVLDAHAWITVFVRHVVAVVCWKKLRMAACCAKLVMSKVRFRVRSVSNSCPLAEVSSARPVIGAGC